MEKSKSESKPERHIANPYGNAEIGIKYGEMKESLKIHLDLSIYNIYIYSFTGTRREVPSM